jgi:preprotein translocase subunit SecE
MFNRMSDTFLGWPSWLKMLLLVTFAVLTMTMVITSFAWLVDLLN